MCLAYSNSSSYLIDDCDSCWKKAVSGINGGKHMKAKFNCIDTNLIVNANELFGKYDTVQCANVNLFKSEVIRIIIDIHESCDVSEIPSKVFNSFRNLNDLKIVLPTLKSLNAWIDFESIKLESFAVHGNNLPELPASLFAKTPQLKNVFVMDTQFDRIDPEAFRKVINLEQLRITGASLITLPRDLLKGLINLKTINLSDNNFTNVNVLDFNDCKIIHTFNLQRNKITQLTEQSLNGMENLSHLFLSDNQISQIAPNSFSKMQNLHTLTLAHSKLNRLTKLMFDGLTNLKVLDLNYSMIQYIDGDTFSIMNKLEKLNLTGNLITTLDTQTFNHLNALSILDLSFNKLQQFNLFYTLSQLTYLNVSNNNIVKLIDDEIDTNIPMKLQKLDLSYNPIASLKPNIFNGLGNLLWLELAHCQLTSFDLQLLYYSKNMTILNLSSKSMRNFIIPDSLPFYSVWKGLYMDHEQANIPLTKLPSNRKRFPNLDVYLNRIPSDNFYTWGKECTDGWDV